MAGSDGDTRRGRWIRAGATFGSLAIAAVIGWSLLGLIRGSESTLDRIHQLRADQITTVPTFARPLGRGTVIAAEDLVLVEIPEAMVPDGALRTADLAVGRTLAEPVLSGDLLRRERLARSAATGLRAIVPPGLRAVALDLDPTSFVSGSVLPGNRVDVIVTLPEDGGAPAQTKTVLKGVRVLAVDEWISETAMGEEIRRSQVTLAVQPGDGLRVVHAARLSQGRVRLALIGELEGLVGEAPAARSRRVGREDQRVDAAAFRDRYSDADVDAMYRRYHGDDVPRGPIVEPALVRGLEPPRP